MTHVYIFHCVDLIVLCFSHILPFCPPSRFFPPRCSHSHFDTVLCSFENVLFRSYFDSNQYISHPFFYEFGSKRHRVKPVIHVERSKTCRLRNRIILRKLKKGNQSRPISHRMVEVTTNHLFDLPINNLGLNG